MHYSSTPRTVRIVGHQATTNVATWRSLFLLLVAALLTTSVLQYWALVVLATLAMVALSFLQPQDRSYADRFMTRDQDGHQLTVSMTPRTSAMVSNLASRKSINASTLVNRAIQVYALADEIEARGDRLLVADARRQSLSSVSFELAASQTVERGGVRDPEMDSGDSAQRTGIATG